MGQCVMTYSKSEAISSGANDVVVVRDSTGTFKSTSIAVQVNLTFYNLYLEMA